MENLIGEAIEDITKLKDGEEDVKELVGTVNSVVDNVNQMANWVASVISSTKAPKEVKDAFSACWEYVGFYVVLLVSISATFGFVAFDKFDWEAIIKLALVLTSAILIGAIKEMLWKQIKERDKTIDVLKEENKALETALSTQSIENSRLKTRYNKVVDYVRDREPTFNPDLLFYPKAYSDMYREQENRSNIKHVEKRYYTDSSFEQETLPFKEEQKIESEVPIHHEIDEDIISEPSYRVK